jgi:ketosteroid isomerase-like protein
MSRERPMTGPRALVMVIAILSVACRSVAVGSVDQGDFGLRRTAESYALSFATRNADSVVAYFDSSIVVVSPQGRTPVEGIAANRAGWERLFRGGNPSHRITIERVEVAASGDLGWVSGRWAVGVDTPGGRSEARGHYLSVWRRRGDVWRQIAVSAYVLP